MPSSLPGCGQPVDTLRVDRRLLCKESPFFLLRCKGFLFALLWLELTSRVLPLTGLYPIAYSFTYNLSPSTFHPIDSISSLALASLRALVKLLAVLPFQDVSSLLWGNGSRPGLWVVHLGAFLKFRHGINSYKRKNVPQIEAHFDVLLLSRRGAPQAVQLPVPGEVVGKGND